MTSVIIISFFLVGCPLSLSVALVTKTSTHDFNIYQIGDMKLILTASHDGERDPSMQVTNNALPWPDRTEGCKSDVTAQCEWHHDCGTTSPDCSIRTYNDEFTKSITLTLADEIRNITGQRPHVILADVRRRKVDVNREVGEAALGVSDAILAYNDFHSFVEEAHTSILPNQGLLIDVHGQTHTPERVELGYKITGSRLDSGDYWPTLSTIEYNGKKVCPDDDSRSDDHECFYKLIRGNESLGYFLADKGVAALPGPDYLSPDGTDYFTGGYIVGKYGSKVSGTVDAIQMELPRGIRETFDDLYKNKIAMSILEYYKLHYDADLNIGTSTGSLDITADSGTTSNTNNNSGASSTSKSGSESVTLPNTSLVFVTMLFSIVFFSFQTCCQ